MSASTYFENGKYECKNSSAWRMDQNWKVLNTVAKTSFPQEMHFDNNKVHIVLSDSNLTFKTTYFGQWTKDKNAETFQVLSSKPESITNFHFIIVQEKNEVLILRKVNTGFSASVWGCKKL